MQKLRSQVSRFLSMQKELEKVSEQLSAKEVCLDSSDCLRKTVSFLARGSTPPNSPTANQAHKQYLVSYYYIILLPHSARGDESYGHRSIWLGCRAVCCDCAYGCPPISRDSPLHFSTLSLCDATRPPPVPSLGQIHVQCTLVPFHYQDTVISTTHSLFVLFYL